MGITSGNGRYSRIRPEGESGDLRTSRYQMSLGRLASWWGKGLTKATIRNWSERMISHTGTETRSRLFGRQQWGIWTMGESLIPAMPRVKKVFGL